MNSLRRAPGKARENSRWARGPLTGNGNAAIVDAGKRNRLAGNQQRSHYPLAKRPARVQQLIPIQYQRQHPIADLGNIQLALQCPLVKGFNILQPDVKIKPFRIDLFVDQGIENESVIRTGTKAQGKCHVELAF